MPSPTKSKAGRSSKTKIIAVVSIIVILAGGGTTGLLYVKAQNSENSSESTVTYESYTVAKGDVDVSVQESGTIAAGTATSIKADQDIKIAVFQAQVGDAVGEGDMIASIDTDALQTVIDTLQTSVSTLDAQLAAADASEGNSYLSSTIEGRIKLLNVEEDDLIQKNMADFGYLCVISTDGKMKITFTPAEGTTAAVGDTLTVIFEDDSTDTAVIESQTTDGQYVAVIGDDTYDVGTIVDIVKADGTNIGSAEIEVNAPIPVTLSSGIVSSVCVEENDYVYSGSTLLYLTEGQLSESVYSLISQRDTAWEQLLNAKALLANPVITAYEDGVVTSVSSAVGNEIKANEEIYQIVPATSFVMTISVDELDISKISKGQEAVITVDALSDQTINGTVTRISNIGTTSNSVTTYSVTVTLDKTEGLMAAMSASCTIAIDSASDVLYVPVGAIQTIANKKYVLVSGAAAASYADTANTSGTLVEVQLGLVNDSYAEITSGLTEGQIVLVPTFSSSSNTLTDMAGGFSAGPVMGDMSGGSRPSGQMPDAVPAT